MNFEELRASLEARNELRRQSQLPLLDVEKEIERHREDEREAAYWALERRSLLSRAGRSSHQPRGPMKPRA